MSAARRYRIRNKPNGGHPTDGMNAGPRAAFLRLERGEPPEMGGTLEPPEPVNGIRDAYLLDPPAGKLYSCPECAGRCANKLGHPVGVSGKPRCLEPPEMWG